MIKLTIQLILALSSMFLVQAQHLRQGQDERQDQLRLACTVTPMTKCDLGNAPGKGVYICRSYGTYNVGRINTTLCVPPLMILPKDGCECCQGTCPTICECPCGKWKDGGRLLSFTLPNGIDVKQCYPTPVASFLATAFFPHGFNPYSCVSRTDQLCRNSGPIDGEEPAGGWDPVPDINEFFPIAGYDENGNPIISENATMIYYPEYDPDLNEPVGEATPIVEAPIQEAPVEKVPYDQGSSVEEVPVLEAPDVPFEQVPILEAPVQEAPVLDVPDVAVPMPDEEEAPGSV